MPLDGSAGPGVRGGDGPDELRLALALVAELLVLLALVLRAPVAVAELALDCSAAHAVRRSTSPAPSGRDSGNLSSGTHTLSSAPAPLFWRSLRLLWLGRFSGRRSQMHIEPSSDVGSRRQAQQRQANWKCTLVIFAFQLSVMALVCGRLMGNREKNARNIASCRRAQQQFDSFDRAPTFLSEQGNMGNKAREQKQQ